MDFPIIVNNKKIMYSEINSFLKRGQTKQAILFIIERAECTEKEANEVISDIRDMIIERNQKKDDFSKIKADTLKSSNNNQNIPKCPKCGSTSITAIQRKWNIWRGFATNKVDMVCNQCGTVVK